MAADGKQGVELWKAVVGLGSALTVAGLSVLYTMARTPSETRLEAYGLTLVIGGLALIVLGLVYAFRQQHEWRRPPKLPRGMTCRSYQLKVDSRRFPNEPHFQDLYIPVHRRFSTPAFRVTCSAPLRKIEGNLINPLELPLTLPRTILRFDFTIDAASFYFVPIEPIEPPALINLRVFSDETIQVLKIKRLRLKLPPQTPPPTDPPPSTAS